MTQIEGGNNPSNRAHVDTNGRIEAHAVSISEQSDSALSGDAYNLNTGTFQLTSAAATAIFYIKNDSEERELIIPRVFVSFGVSTGGSGPVEASIMSGPTSGSIITSGVSNPPQNFNFGSSRSLEITSLTGSTALGDCTGGTTPVRFYFNSDNSRHLVGFDSIILPRGASFCFTVIPPAGNTSMDIQAGANIYLATDEHGS